MMNNYRRLSFQELWENSKKGVGRDFWDGKREVNDQGLSTIKKGLEVRPDRADGNSFWDDFITVVGNNIEGVANLLEVKPDVVSRWPGKVKEALSQVKQSGDDDKKTEMMPTGN